MNVSFMKARVFVGDIFNQYHDIDLDKLWNVKHSSLGLKGGGGTGMITSNVDAMKWGRNS